MSIPQANQIKGLSVETKLYVASDAETFSCCWLYLYFEEMQVFKMHIFKHHIPDLAM